MIEQQWYTGRLRVSDSVAEELPELERILESNHSTLLVDGNIDSDPDELRRWLDKGDLPPGGRKERYRLQTLYRKDNGDAIGYISFYHGHPDENTLYIASIAIRQDCQNNGFGGEVVNRLPFLEGLKGYTMHRLVVTVRNWGAVQFWVRHGFTQIVNVIGNLHQENGSSARLELVRDSGTGC